MNFPDPHELERWRCRNACILRGLRGIVVGVIVVAVVWFVYRLLRS
jgi:hypothetical protein